MTEFKCETCQFFNFCGIVYTIHKDSCIIKQLVRNRESTYNAVMSEIDEIKEQLKLHLSSPSTLEKIPREVPVTSKTAGGGQETRARGLGKETKQDENNGGKD